MRQLSVMEIIPLTGESKAQLAFVAAAR